MLKTCCVDFVTMFGSRFVRKVWAGNEAGPVIVGWLGVRMPTCCGFCTEVPRMSAFTFDTQSWSEDHFGNCHLGDKRRTKRLVRLATQAVSNPAGSLPEQAETWADLKGAYRLFDSAHVTFEAVTELHYEQVRARDAGRYLVLGDTTELDFGIHRDIPDLGPTGNGGGWGFLLHSGLLVDADSEEMFGLAGQTIHYRKPAPKKECKTKRLKRERESKVWGDVIEMVGRPSEGVELVHVLDRGADNFEVYCHCVEEEVDWVVRVTQKQRYIFTPDGEKVPLKKYLGTLPQAGTYELSLRARPNQAARTAKIEVYFGAVEVPPPKQTTKYVKRINPGPIPMWVVHVREVDAASGVEPIEWILLTSLVVEKFEDAWEVIGYYEKRWLIEEWHKALKTGCRVTERQLKTKERLEPLVGLLSVVSVRLLQLKSVARSNPDCPARRMIPKQWITMLRACRNRGRRTKLLTVGEFYLELAKLGGFIGRKSDGEPGWITIWRGWHKLNLMVRGAKLAGVM